jgi:dipeptide/tripeptide permease
MQLIYLLPILHLCERVAYYGLHTALLLYCLAPLGLGGLAFSDHRALTFTGYYFGLMQVLPLLGGMLNDKIANKRLLLLISFFAIASGYFLLAKGTLPLLYAGLSLLAVGFAPIRIVLLALLAHHYPKVSSNSAKAYSWFYAAATLGVLLSGFLTGLTELDGHQWLRYFIQMGWLSFFGAAATLLLLISNPTCNSDLPIEFKSLEAPTPQILSTPWRALAIPYLLFTLLALTFYTLSQGAFSSVVLFVSQRVDRMIYWPTAIGEGREFVIPIGWLISIASLMTLGISLGLGKLWEKLATHQRLPSPWQRACLGILLTAVGYLSLGISGIITPTSSLINPWTLLIFNFGFSSGKSLTHPALWEALAQVTPKPLHGRIIGVSFLYMGLGNMIFPTLLSPLQFCIPSLELLFTWTSLTILLVTVVAIKMERFFSEK